MNICIQRISRVSFNNLLKSTNYLAYVNTSSRHIDSTRNVELSINRAVSTYTEKPSNSDDRFALKVLRKIPFLKVDQLQIKSKSFCLYESIADQINYVEFFEKYKIPDTFYGWFVITELHIWMVSARAMAEGDQGEIIRNSMLQAFWADVAIRVKKLGVSTSSVKTNIHELSDQLQASLIAYDEGLQSDDIVLAGALWRRLYQMSFVSPEQLEELVKYIRKHMSNLDQIDKDELLDGKYIWDKK